MDDMVLVRWRSEEPDSGYEFKLPGDRGWTEIGSDDIKGFLQAGYMVHFNPA